MHTSDQRCELAAAELGRLCDEIGDKPDVEQRREIARKRDELYQVLLQCHAGDADTANDDDRFDVIFSRAAGLAEEPKKPNYRGFGGSAKSRKGADGSYVGRKFNK
tara:strand:+ start:437 stop:754 length:318 start_codon:yes stop_codon:yes gene_type:complete